MLSKNYYLDWIGNLLIMISMLLIALNYELIGFIILMTADIIWLFYGIISYQKSFIFYNIIYFFIALYGFLLRI
jgi:hypothetical protein